jgi:hypothetical protein
LSLPVLKQTIFEFDLPSTGQKIQFRPFTVAEEKILLMAQAADDSASKISAVKHIINNCCVAPINVDKLANFDIEYFFVQLRAKSVSNIVEAEIEIGGKKQKLIINLDDAKVKNDAVKKLILSESEGIGVTLHFPTFELIQNAQSQKEDPTAALGLFRDLIDTIFTAEEVFDVKQHPAAELDAFLDSLNLDQLQVIQEWIVNLPYIYIDVPYQDENNEQKTIQLRGLENFFGS